MASGKGFVVADRDLFQHPIWLDEPFTKGQAWMDLIALANHQNTTLYVRGKSIEGKRGEVNRSYRFLAKRWKWSVDKVRRFIAFLEAEQMVRHETRQRETVITLCNYCYFQDRYRKNETQNETQNETRTRHEQQLKQLYKQQSYCTDNNDNFLDVDDIAMGRVPEHLQHVVDKFIRGESDA